MPFAQHFFGAIAILVSALDALAVRVAPFRAHREIFGFGSLARRQILKTLVTAESADPNKNSPSPGFLETDRGACRGLYAKCDSRLSSP